MSDVTTPVLQSVSDLARRYRAVMTRIIVVCALLLAPFHLLAQNVKQMTFVTGNDFGDFSGESLEDGGMATEVVKAALRLANVDVDVVFDDWAAGYAKTATGGYDGTFPYYFTKERAGEYVYGDSVYEIVERFFYLSSNKKIEDLSRPSDLEGLTICYPSGWAAAASIQALFDSGRATRNTPGDMTRCFDLLANQQVDIVLAPELQGYNTIDSLPNLDSFDVEIANWEVDIKTLSAIFPKQPGVDSACSHAVHFNTGLASLRANGGFNDIARNWFGRVAQLASPDESYVLVRRTPSGSEEFEGTVIGLRGLKFYIDSEVGIVGVPVEEILWFSRADFDASKADCTARSEVPTPTQPVTTGAIDPLRTMSIAGSEALAKELGPDLLSHWLKRSLEVDPDHSDTYRVQSPSPDIRLPEQLKVDSTDAATAFNRLARGEVELVITDRQPNQAERSRLAAIELVPSSKTEHVFALEGLAIVVNPSRRVTSLSVQDIESIVEGQIKNWLTLGSKEAALELAMDRDLAEAIKHGALRGKERRLGDNVGLLDSHNEVISQVAADRNIMGLVPLGLLESFSVVPVPVNECGMSYAPREFTTRTEEYPLTRRLYMYYLPSAQPVFAGAFVRHAEGEGQPIITESGDIDLTIQPQDEDAYVEAFENRNRSGEQVPVTVSGLRERTLGARRLSATFRFVPGNASLDARSVRDAERLADYMQSQQLSAEDIALVGYADSDGLYANNCALSLSRARSVAEALSKEGVSGQFDVYGACEEAPVACNTTSEGKSLNRRVEVWKHSR